MAESDFNSPNAQHHAEGGPSSTASQGSDSGQAPPVKRRKKRSPAHPRARFEDVLPQARRLLEEANAQHYDIPFHAAASLLGIASPKSNAFRALLTSMKYFGLATQSEVNGGPHLRLTQRAVKILTDRRSVSPERDEAIRKAVLAPEIYRELWDEWRAKGVPAKDVLDHHLEHDRGFNRNSIDSFLSDFRANLDFAGLDPKAVHYPDPADAPAGAANHAHDPGTDAADDTGREPLEDTTMDAASQLTPRGAADPGVFDSALSIDAFTSSFRVPKNTEPADFQVFEEAVLAQLKLLRVRLGIPPKKDT